jgi:tRNA-guanine family transglycosylase
MLNKLSTLTERNRAIEKTIANATELNLLMTQYSKKIEFSKQKIYSIEPMAIVQGFDKSSLRYCAKSLKELGYSKFGIGSMAHLYDTSEIIKRVEAVQSVVGSNVHIFGVSSVQTLKLLGNMGVTSVDSSRPIKAAIYNEILYSEPYQRVGIAGSNFSPTARKFSEGKMLTELTRECPCPVCEGGVNNDLLKLGTRKHLLLRAVHNYYHLKKMISSWDN